MRYDYSDLPFFEEYEDVFDENDTDLLIRIARHWNEDIDNIFYDYWDSNDYAGSIFEDYYYVLDEYYGNEIADRIFNGRDIEIIWQM